MDNDMTFNFDQIIDRRASDSAKWNYFAADVLPMWVADMDFTAPPAVIEALQARIAHGVFGYGMDSKPLRELLAARMDQLYRWQVAPEDIVLLPGLVCGLNVVSAAIGAPGDGVLTNTPVYGPFLTAPVNQGRVLQSAPLACRASGQELYYTLDMAATAAAVQPNTRLFLLCNPHNPVGRAYTRAELQEIADLCARNDLVICSDEIHCDLLLDETQHIPIAALDPATAARTVTLMAPSKTYNVPGLGASFAIVQDKELRQRVERAATGIVPHVNILGAVAMEAAYRHGDAWLHALRAYLTANRDFAVGYIREHLPAVRVTVPEATYLLWLDCRAAIQDGTPAAHLMKEVRLAVNEGSWFGDGGDGFIRLNFGCPRATLTRGLELLRQALG
jgi:cystathionine beta-lyase